MFKLQAEPQISIYKKVQRLFTSPENLHYLRQYTGVDPEPKNYSKFLDQYISKVSRQLTPEENVLKLNQYVMQLSSTDAPKSPITRVIEEFSSGPNVDYLNRIFSRDMLEKVFKFKRQARIYLEENGSCSLKELNDYFIDVNRHEPATKEDYFLETAFKETLLFPKGYESFNSGGLRRVDTGCDYYEPRTEECTGRKYRYEKIPYWQKTSTYARTMEGQEFERHLGASVRELGERHTKLMTFRK
jgi:hypothetical protein